MKSLLTRWRTLHHATRADITGFATVAAILLLYSTIEFITEALCK
jgi:hypothetical protein